MARRASLAAVVAQIVRAIGRWQRFVFRLKRAASVETRVAHSLRAAVEVDDLRASIQTESAAAAN